jgi:hypothetical protein
MMEAPNLTGQKAQFISKRVAHVLGADESSI